MLKIIIPLAGSSELFQNSGYHYPKPLIEINGTPMIQLVIEKLVAVPEPFQIIFIIAENDAHKYHLDNTLKLLSPGCEIIKLKKHTKGGLCSVLMAIDHIDEDDSLIVINGDQVIDEDFDTIYKHWIQSNADAGVITFTSVHPRWSYARLENNRIVQTAEKNPISKHAIAGFYYFANAKMFFDAAFQVILKDVQLEGLYYISPVMNELILKNKNVLQYQIPNSKYHSFYSPQMIKEFEKTIS